MFRALRTHWPEYLMEAAGLGFFMVSAGLFGTLFEARSSPVRAALDDAFVRRVLMGLAMGLTAVAIIYSPWGKRSGAHINPATTLTFWRLGKVAGPDAVWYVVAQFAGGLAGALLVALLLGDAFLQPPVEAVATTPGPAGAGIAFVAEMGIGFLTIIVVLWMTNAMRLVPYTGLVVGCLVAGYVIFESPLSGFGMNPARSFASAVPAGNWMAWWVYLLAPPLGMLTAAEVYLRVCGAARVRCAKLQHDGPQRCIFCEFQAGKHAASHAPAAEPAQISGEGS